MRRYVRQVVVSAECVRIRSAVPAVALLCTLGLGGLRLAWADPPQCCVPGGMYGDGTDGNLTVPQYGSVTLERDMNFSSLTVETGATLDTAGFVVRVCGTLTNRGVITDSVRGGAGGAGGAGGSGANPAQDAVPAGCPARQPACTPGDTGQPGSAGTCVGAGQGGHSGAGGGGGGGARRVVPNCEDPSDPNACADADGGNGGAGGAGGKGGGCVRIYVLRLDNAEGVIHADGANGESGQAAPNYYDSCGAQYRHFKVGQYLQYHKDLAGGGGGGGTGGGGGDGGTVEIHYAVLLTDEGQIHAYGGAAGSGGSGGLGGRDPNCPCLCYGGEPGMHDVGCLGGGPPPGGQGGDGAHLQGACATNGAAGASGSAGAPGARVVNNDFNDCNHNGVPDECDVSPRLFAASCDNPPWLNEVNWSDPSVNPIGPLHPEVVSVSALAYQPTTAQLYALVGRATGQSWLAVVDSLTAEVQFICETDSSLRAIAFRRDGTLYGVRLGQICTIDTTDCTITETPCAGSGFAMGGAFIGGTDRLFMASFVEMVDRYGNCVCHPHVERVTLHDCQTLVFPAPTACEIGPIAFHPSVNPFLGYGGDGTCQCAHILYQIDVSDGTWTPIGDTGICMCGLTFSTLGDCNHNGTPDDCELVCNDCNHNLLPDECDVQADDCNSNGIPDDCDLRCGDCDRNGIPDDCEIAADPNLDVWPPPNGNGCLDECDTNDCNTNYVDDWYDIYTGTSKDVNHNCVPDECELIGDMNCDGALNFDDINPFVVALSNCATYEQDHPNCYWLSADVNCDRLVNFDDINSFVACLASTPVRP